MSPPRRFKLPTARIFPGAARAFGCVLIAWLTMAAVYEPPARPAPGDLKDTQPVLGNDPARAVVYQGRGIKLVNDGKLEAALDQFRRAAALDQIGRAHV